MNDLLADVDPGDIRSPSKDEEVERDIEAGIIKDPEIPKDGGLLDFFQEVQHVKDDMDKIQSVLGQLQEANEESKSVTKAATMKVLKEKMESYVDEVIKMTRLVKGKLEKMEEDNLSHRRKPGCEEGTSVDRSRMAMTVSLKKKLKDLMGKFQSQERRQRQSLLITS